MEHSFLQPETKSGFYVDGDRKLLWKIEMDMLIEVKRICEKYQIDYFLHSGSALGAVRHQGFIPWDDDLDLGMLRKDFEKFVAVAKDELPNNMFLQYGMNDGGHVCGLLRIRDSNSTGIIKIDKDKDCNNGVYIEVYPFDCVPDNRLKARMQYICSLVLYHGLLANYYGPFSKNQVLCKLIVKALGVDRAYKIWQGICQRYNNSDTKYVNTVALPDYMREGVYQIKRQWLAETQEVPFEYITAKVPVAVDEMLKLNYGDYWKLPEQSDRGELHRRTVFFDPRHPYTYYKGNKIVDEYFEK